MTQNATTTTPSTSSFIASFDMGIKRDVSVCTTFGDQKHLDKTRPNFPTTSTQGKGRFVGIAESLGDTPTCKIPTDGTQKVINRSTVHSDILSETDKNLHLDQPGGESTFSRLRMNSRPIDDNLSTICGDLVCGGCLLKIQQYQQISLFPEQR